MNILTSITSVFTAMGEWFVDIMPTLLGIFWQAETGLTILGYLAVASLAISVIFLIIGVIQNFLHFRG